MSNVDSEEENIRLRVLGLRMVTGACALLMFYITSFLAGVFIDQAKYGVAASCAIGSFMTLLFCCISCVSCTNDRRYQAVINITK